MVLWFFIFLNLSATGRHNSFFSCFLFFPFPDCIGIRDVSFVVFIFFYANIIIIFFLVFRKIQLNKMKYIAFSLFFLLFSVHSLFGQMILIDDDFSDWQNTPAAYTDTNGDNGFSSIDFGKLWINNDEAFLFFNIEVTYEIN